MALNLELHHKETGDNENLIILIHGLGAPDTTWVNDGVSWIDLLLTDKELLNMDVATASYDTAHLANRILSSAGVKKFKIGMFKTFSVAKGPFTSLEILARELKREVDSHRIQKYKRVILVGHSMGGLIAVRYLLEEIEHNQAHNIKGLISLATPYNGSSFALYSQLIKSLNKHAQIPSLEPNSLFLDDTIRLWKKHLDTINVHFKFFFGTNDNIVTENSAIPHIVSSKWTGGIPLPGDHSSILFVEDHNSTSYRNVSETIQTIIKEDYILKKKIIEKQRSLSKARCIARFKANGLNGEQANGLLNKRYDFKYLEPDSNNKLVVIVGEFGVGKSFAMDKIYLDLLEKAEKNSDFPMPIYINSTQVEDNIQNYIEEVMENEHSEQWFIIDGMDEISLSMASKILEEARVSIERWNNLRIILTSRPLSIFNNISERRLIQLLSEEESLNLINFINSKENNIIRIMNFPPNVKEAIKRPLFSIILGLYLDKFRTINPNSIGDLLIYLIEHSLEKIEVSEDHTKKLLMHLAKLTTSRGNIPIRKNEIGSIDEIKNILDSGIITEKDGYISFALPILTQWFAAKALSENLVSIEEIIEKENNLDYWKYAIIILITVFKEQQIDDTLGRVAEAQPGFASTIIEEGIAKWGLQNKPSNLSAVECGEKLRMSMESWIKGIGGTLASIIAPISPNAVLLPLGVEKHNDFLSASWYRGDKNIPNISILTPELRGQDVHGWGNYRSARPGDTLNWYWRWTFEELRDNLSRVIKNKSLPVCSKIIYEELMWSTTLHIMKKGSLYSGIISIEDVYSKLEKDYKFVNVIGISKKLIPMEIYLEYLESLDIKGVKEISPPIPAADIKNPSNHWVWGLYSQERLHLRTSQIFKEAVIGYREMVATLFPALKDRLVKYVIYPFILKGELHIDDDQRPTLDWYTDPLPIHENFRVEIDISTDDSTKNKDSYHNGILENIHHNIKEYRPFANEWLSATHTGQILDIFGDMPVTDLIYWWLENDLKRIYWMK